MKRPKCLYESGHGTPRVMAPAWKSAVIAAGPPPIWGWDVGKRGGVLFSVDHHQGSEEQQPGQEYYDPDLLDPVTGRINTFPLFCKTIRELSLEDTVIPMVIRSEVVARFWNTLFSLIFMDGGHTVETVFTDYNVWVSHLLPGGYLVLHDIFPEPAQGGQAPYCIYSMALASGLFKKISLRIQTLGVLKRAPAGTLTDEIKEALEPASGLSPA